MSEEIIGALSTKQAINAGNAQLAVDSFFGDMATFKAKTRAKRFQLLHKKAAATQRAQLHIEPPGQLAFGRPYLARNAFSAGKLT
ncbi:hypothetical protein O1611_g4949 [Lasiodiplodia mahajangana]|uniref:Uncharacterized protein n=1 Tax=Lasiodiplodia mahajangana TaxID=1108764 RepID=A0ACC2JN56_9PEZI|nr:hypothetical protein O1611_g4949 [Lasiodiplodia mahajangana]